MIDALKAKTASKWGQIFASLWIFGWSAFKFIATPSSISIADIVVSGAGIAACFTPIYFSILMDKIKNVE